jgi:hypothetical protein
MAPPRQRPSRRAVLAGGAALAAGTLPAGLTLAAAPVSDRQMLALLGAVEQVQIDHYAAIVSAFDETAFAAEGFPNGTRARLKTIARAEDAQLAVLDGDDPAALGAPLVETLRAALVAAAELENLAVAAYAGVIDRTGRQGLVPELAGILSAEARHAAWLLTVLDEDPFPEPIDAPLPPDEVLARLEAILGTPSAATPVADGELALALASIAEELGVAVDEVNVVSAEPREWPDSSLGCPQEGQLYLQVITPGYLVTVSAGGEEITFHTDLNGNVVRCD